MNQFEKSLLKTPPIKSSSIDGREVLYQSPKTLDGFFGYALDGRVFIRSNPPRRVEKFVINHEIYHLNDRSKYLGWFGAELRANLYCGLRDPIGLILTSKESMNRDRLTKYWNLARKRGRVS